MNRLLGIAALYLAMFVAWTAGGLFLLFFPARAGNLLHDSFGLCPEVRPNDRAKKTVLRVIGLGLLAFAFHVVQRVAALVRG